MVDFRVHNASSAPDTVQAIAGSAQDDMGFIPAGTQSNPELADHAWQKP